MKAAFPILPILVTLGVAASAQTTSIQLAVELPETPTTAGARVFAEKSCIRCHSLGDSGGAHIGPDLARMQFSGTVLDLAGTFWNHSPVMREKMQELKIQSPTLSRTEMTELLAFLAMYRYYVTETGSPGDRTAGRVVFRSKGCAGCHGEEGARGHDPAPDLQTYRGTSAIFLAQAMWNHGPDTALVIETRGPISPRFVGREMTDLVAHLQAGRASARGEPIYVQPGSPSRGRALFRSTGCSACHAVAGQGGGRGGPDLGTRGGALIGSVSETAGAMWNHSQGMIAEFDRRGISRLMLSPQEMADIIAYLYFANYADVRGTPTRGEQLFIAKCAMCHSIGGGRKVGPDLAAVQGLDGPIAIIAAMWNHAPMMQLELLERGLAWPKLERGEPADLIAFLLSRLRVAGEPRVARQ